MSNKNDSKRPWKPYSWKSLPAKHQPTYNDHKSLNKALTHLRSLPPLVHAREIESLRKQLSEAEKGERFLMQGGDCAERFADCSARPIEAKLKILLQMSLILTWGARIPAIKMGRMAGQYSKPRSSEFESQTDEKGNKIPTFKGDSVHGYDMDQRQTDPNRLVQAHFHSAATLNYIRALLSGGFADLHHSELWDLGGVRDDTKRNRYNRITTQILEALDFMEACGAQSEQSIQQVDFFTSHEGLLLPYEAEVTEKVGDFYYNLGTHMLWIGNRTKQLKGAHVEYFRGIRNPIGIKVGPKTDADELIRLLRIVNPDNETGKIILISRMGADNVDKVLPLLVTAIQRNDMNVLWSCDPMHGNTYKTSDGIKTRHFDQILLELSTTFNLLADMGSHLGGVHFELTGEHVTEVVGGGQNLNEKDLHLHYTSYCDPRLNYLQSMEMAFLLADLLRQRNKILKVKNGGSNGQALIRSSL